MKKMIINFVENHDAFEIGMFFLMMSITFFTICASIWILSMVF